MANHDFTLIIEGRDIHNDEVFDALYEAGCDDALFRSKDGTQYMDFTREAATLDEAISSAVRDIETVDGVRVARIPDSRKRPGRPAFASPALGR